MLPQEQHEWGHLKWLGAGLALEGRQHVFGELHKATGAPRDHLAGLRLRELADRIASEPGCSLGITGAELDDATAMRRAAHDAIAHPERVHDIETEQCDMRRFEYVAASVEHDVRHVAVWPS